jgi:hypothetical protein
MANGSVYGSKYRSNNYHLYLFDLRQLGITTFAIINISALLDPTQSTATFDQLFTEKIDLAIQI